MSAHTTSTRTLVVALAREPWHCRVQVRRGGDHRLVGDAHRRRSQRGRFDEPAAADVGPPPGEAAARQASSVRLRPRALFLELCRRRPGVRAGAAFRFTKASSTSPHPEEAVSPLSPMAFLLVAFLLEGWSTLEAFRDFKEAKGNSAGSRRCGARRTRRASSSCSRMAPRWPESSPQQSALALAAYRMIHSYDGAASVVIGIILGLTAFVLAYESKALLIGEAADPVLVASLRELASPRRASSASAMC